MHNFRYESKFVFRLIDENECFKRFTDSGLPLKKHFPDRVVNNLYFDDHMYSFYLDNLSGISKRKKLRFRWYGDKKIDIIGNLELKLKDNNLGSKFVESNISIANIYENKFANLKHQILQQTNNEYLWMLLKQYLNPTIYNSYNRSYFLLDKGIRVTFDRLISSKYLRGSDRIASSMKIVDPKILIIEIKSDRANENLLREYLGKLAMTRTRYSKYASGLINSYRNGIFSNVQGE